ncbi:hypothetical protein SAMN02746065_11539 [Desulfocicer vacuolatum DSM 3385]|uniref:Uncharacterized protein n=2 Tax=Desulfocicer vacuolatum TaxID=2298 RepID=A0A1W2D4T0_9BACT|nr:hypothetical protein SAMN02746065_11539 [Desulfocicer vacuolatum DSM 3385]
MISSEEEFSETFTTLNPLKLLDCIQDDYSRYYRQIVKEMFELDADLECEIEKIKLQPPNIQVEKFMNLLLDRKFPWTMYDDNLFEDSDDAIRNIQITLRRIIVDALFYMLAAYDIEYNHHFSKHLHGDKLVFLIYLPFYEGNTLQNPSKLWLNRLKALSGFKEINNFATAIPQLGVPPKNKDTRSQKRMMQKWIKGKDKQLPSWENVNSISEVVIKSNNVDENNIELYKEQGRNTYAHVKIFQILLNRLMVDESQELFGMDNKGVVEFFERYLYWHNYHAVMFMENQH